MKPLAALLFATLLSGCSGTPQLYSVPAPTVSEKVRTSVRTLELREVSLPSYAAAEEIHIQNADGSITPADNALWADLPVRAVSLELSRNLSEITDARIAAEPWPFEESPQARLEVRLEEFLAGADGVFRASGQYFVATREGNADHAHAFRISTPFDPAGGPSAIAQARANTILQLAQMIAKDGL